MLPAPLVKVFNDNLGIVEGLMVIILAITATQLKDGWHACQKNFFLKNLEMYDSKFIILYLTFIVFYLTSLIL